MNLFILLIIIPILYYLLKNKHVETFISAYNAFTQNIDTSISSENIVPTVITISQENDAIINSIENKTLLKNLDGIKFIPQVYVIQFPLQDSFKSFILSFLNSLKLTDRLNDPIVFSITLNFSNIQTANGCNSIYYLFTSDIINQNLNVPQLFDICIKTTDTTIDLIYMRKKIYNSTFNVNSKEDDLNKNLDSIFQTKNSLFLMAPFNTSLNDTLLK
jgi:hypothetical protein